MIVDDIPSQVESIAATIPRDELGIDRIHKALSGEEALALFRTHTIRLVITDIRMPEMSGVDLIREIRKIDREVKIIVLSGYADFEYAQSIVPYNTSGYLMKPVNPVQLREMIAELIAEVSGETRLRLQQQRNVYAFRENLPALRSELLNRLLHGDVIPYAELERKLFLLDLPFSSQHEVGMFLLRLEGRLQEYENRDRELIEYAVINMAEELFKDAFHLWSCRDPHEYLVFIVTPKGEQLSRKQEGEPSTIDRFGLDCLAASLKKKAESLLNDSLSVVLAVNGTSFPEGVPELYRAVVDGMRRVGDKSRGVFSRLAEAPEQAEFGAMTSLYRPPLLLHLLDTGHWDNAERKLKDIFEELRSAHYPPEYVNEAYFAIANAYQYMAHKKGKLLSELAGSSFRFMQGIPSLKQLEKWTFIVFRRIREAAEEQAEKHKGSMIDKIHAFVEANINDNLSLQTIAAHINLHPAYLSRVYRAETGSNLSEYILRYRMELATYLLRHSDKKIYMIAEMVGYQAVPHFIKLFKAYTKMTPQEYRDRAGMS